MNDMSWLVEWYKTKAMIDMQQKMTTDMFSDKPSLQQVAQQIHDDDPSLSWIECYALATDIHRQYGCN